MAHTYTKRPPGAPVTTNAERIRRYRKRQNAKGKRAVTVWLDDETILALKPHTRPYGEYLSHAIARLLK